MSMIDAELQIETDAQVRRWITHLRGMIVGERDVADNLTEIVCGQAEHIMKLEARIERLERRMKHVSYDAEEKADYMNVFRTEAAMEPEQADPFDTGLPKRPL